MDPEPTRTTEPDEETRAFEEGDARTTAHADDMPTAEEEAAAERAGRPEPSTGEHYREMAERGAATQGEGRID